MQTVALVVGGGGFLGRYIVDRLLSRGTFTVKIFDLRKTFDDERVEFVIGDLCKPEDVARACEGVDIVFHTASPATGRDASFYHKVNVDGTKNLVSACKSKGVRYLVYTSSSSVVFDGTDIVMGDESLPYCKKAFDEYTKTKAIAEEFVLQSNTTGFATCAIRPASIFGPRDVQGWPAMIQAAKEGKSKFQIGDNSNLLDWTYVENVAEAHVLAAEQITKNANTIGGQAYFITNDDPIPFWDMAKYIYKGLGYPLPSIVLPLRLMLIFALISDFICWLLSPIKTLQPTFTYFRVVYIGATRTFNIAKAKRDLGYKPIFTMSEGLAKTLEYFKGVEEANKSAQNKKIE